MEAAKDILEKVKLFFNDLMNPVPAPAPAPAAPLALQEYDLVGGGKVTIDTLANGGIVSIDGNPALPGDIELMDGTKITVGDNGAIINIVLPGVPAAPPAPTEPPPMFSAETFTAFETSTKEKFLQYETQFAQQEEKFSKYEQKFAEYEIKMDKATKVIEQLLSLSQILVENPAAPADPAASKTGNFNTDAKETKVLPILFN